MSAATQNARPASVSSGISRASMTSDVRSRSNYRPDIDGLRALAIIPVVIFHAFPSIMPGGFVGVDIFFVISGFLISNIILQALQRGTFSFAGFYANRIKRIFPALLVLLAACFAFGWFFLLADEYRQLGKHIVGAAAYVENFVLKREAGYFDVRSYLKPLMHLWSLGIEEQFYLTYPLFLWLVWRFRWNPLLFLVSFGVASFGLNLREIHRDPAGAFFLPQTRCWELMAGGAIACWQAFGQRWQPAKAADCASSPCRARQALPPAASNAASLLGLLLIATAVFRIHEKDPFPSGWALLPVGGASLLIWAGPATWAHHKILANKPMVFVGLISYPLYLWHWPILTLPRLIRGTDLSVATRAAGIVLSFVLAWATWRYVENPIRFGRRTWIKTAALSMMSVIIGSAGYIAYARDGFLSRFPSLVADFALSQQVPWATPECRRMVGFEVDYCRNTTSGPPDVLLIGDSHAVSLYRGLAADYHKRSQSLMNAGEANCVPFYDTETRASGVVLDVDCKVAVNRILDFAASSASVRTIILSLRGPLYMTGQGFGPAEADLGPREIFWQDAPPGSSQAEIFKAALAHTVSRLNATGKALILFIDWPELGFDPRSCLARPVRLFSSPPALCGVGRAEVDARNAAYRGSIFELKKQFPGLRVFDPLPYLCDSSACYAMKAGHLLYRDNNHLSVAGATYLSGKFFQEQSFPAERPTVH